MKPEKVINKFLSPEDFNQCPKCGRNMKHYDGWLKICQFCDYRVFDK